MESAAITTRELKAWKGKALLGVSSLFSAVAEGGKSDGPSLALSRREGRRCDAPGIAFLLLAAWGVRSCT